MSVLLDVQGREAKSFRGLRAVGNVSFEVEEGAIVALIGPYGAGKTTIFTWSPAQLRPDDGEILSRRQTDRWAAARPGLPLGIGRTFQDRKTIAGLSVLDNVIVGALRCCARVRTSARIRVDRLSTNSASDRTRAFPVLLTHSGRIEKSSRLRAALATRQKLLLLERSDGRAAFLLECDQLIAFLARDQSRDGCDDSYRTCHARPSWHWRTKSFVLHHGEMIAQGSPAQVILDSGGA